MSLIKRYIDIDFDVDARPLKRVPGTIVQGNNKVNILRITYPNISKDHVVVALSQRADQVSGSTFLNYSSDGNYFELILHNWFTAVSGELQITFAIYSQLPEVNEEGIITTETDTLRKIYLNVEESISADLPAPEDESIFLDVAVMVKSFETKINEFDSRLTLYESDVEQAKIIGISDLSELDNYTTPGIYKFNIIDDSYGTIKNFQLYVTTSMQYRSAANGYYSRYIDVSGGNHSSWIYFRYSSNGMAIYDATVTYNKNAIVSYNNSLYLCIKHSTGNTPSEATSEYWRLFNPMEQLDVITPKVIDLGEVIEGEMEYPEGVTFEALVNADAVQATKDGSTFFGNKVTNLEGSYVGFTAIFLRNEYLIVATPESIVITIYEYTCSKYGVVSDVRFDSAGLTVQQYDGESQTYQLNSHSYDYFSISCSGTTGTSNAYFSSAMLYIGWSDQTGNTTSISNGVDGSLSISSTKDIYLNSKSWNELYDQVQMLRGNYDLIMPSASTAYTKAVTGNLEKYIYISEVGGMSYKIDETIVHSKVTEIKLNDTIIINIPHTIQQLDGYGLGINEGCYNYLDFEKDHLIRKVGSYTFTGKETVTQKSTNTTDVYRFGLSVLKDVIFPVENNSSVANILMAELDAKTVDQTYTCNEGISVNPNGEICIFKTDVQTVTDMQAFLAGKTIYYEYAQQIETAIPEIDTFMEAESGDILTFENEHQNAVPSTIKYIKVV